MKLIVERLKCLGHLKNELAGYMTTTAARRQSVVALDIMDTDGNITILEQFCKDTANLT